MQSLSPFQREQQNDQGLLFYFIRLSMCLIHAFRKFKRKKVGVNFMSNMHIQQSMQKTDFKTETSILPYYQSIKLEIQIFLCTSTNKASFAIFKNNVKFLDFSLFSGRAPEGGLQITGTCSQSAC